MMSSYDYHYKVRVTGKWQIQYSRQHIKIKLSGQVVEESLFDDQGRLLELLR